MHSTIILFSVAAKPRGLDLGSGPSQGNAGQSFQVFSEVENVSNPVPESTGEYRHVPTRKSANRENDQAAGPWNQAKVSGTLNK